jgi:hypothetical protein
MVRIVYMYSFPLMLSVARTVRIEFISSCAIDTLTCLCWRSEVVRLWLSREKEIGLSIAL